MMRSLLCILAAGAGLCPAEFRAAAVKVDITPADSQWLVGYAARRSTGVHDRIYHRIAAMDDGNTRIYFVSSDLCLFSPGLYDEVAGELRRTAGIEPRQFLWSVTHTHSGPEVGPPDTYKMLLGRSDHEWDRTYTERVKTALVNGIREASDKLAPARLTAGTGMAMANINRRARDLDGRISLGLNPEGPVDRQVGLLRLERPDGAVVALIANYAIHGTVLGGKWVEISGDAPGVVADYVERKIGAPMLFINGAAGNLAPIYTVATDPKSGHLSEFNVLLGNRILEANSGLRAATGEVKLWAAEKVIETPRKPELTWPETLPAYARGEMLRLPLRFVRINDTLVWSAPVEMFCELATRVRNESPFPRTFYFGYTNGWFGYLPTAKAFEEGGYEPRTSPFTPRVERDVMEGVISFIQGLPR